MYVLGGWGRGPRRSEQSPNDHHGTYSHHNTLLQTVPVVRRPGHIFRFFSEDIHFLCGFDIRTDDFLCGVKTVPKP